MNYAFVRLDVMETGSTPLLSLLPRLTASPDPPYRRLVDVHIVKVRVKQQRLWLHVNR